MDKFLITLFITLNLVSCKSSMPKAPEPLISANYTPLSSIDVNQITDHAIKVLINDFPYIRNCARHIGEMYCYPEDCNSLAEVAARNGGTHFVFVGMRVASSRIIAGYSTTRANISYNGNYIGSNTTSVPSRVIEYKENVYNVYRVENITNLPESLKPILFNIDPIDQFTNIPPVRYTPPISQPVEINPEFSTRH